MKRRDLSEVGGSTPSVDRAVQESIRSVGGPRLSPAWRSLIQYCGEMSHGEIEKLKIQDGQPILAEMTRSKVKFKK